MLNRLKHDIWLRIQAATGLAAGFVFGLAFAALAVVMVFVFLCVTGYAWLSHLIGPVLGGLAMTGICLVLTALGIAIALLSRQHAREEATRERAERARSLAIAHPAVLQAIIQAGRTLGWRRIAPLAVIGFVGAHLAQDIRGRDMGQYRA